MRFMSVKKSRKPTPQSIIRRSPRWMIRSVDVAAIPSGPVTYTEGWSKDDASPRARSWSSIHHATSSRVVTPGVTTSLEKARSAISRLISPASANAASSVAVRVERKSLTSFSADTSRSAYGAPSTERR